MREIIFNSGNYATLLADAKTLGFVDADNNIVTNGAFESGGGWFLNIVGMVYDGEIVRPGYWGRLRLNGTPEVMPVFSSAIVQYLWNEDINGWTVDGKTVAPDWVGFVGVIA